MKIRTAAFACLLLAAFNAFAIDVDLEFESPKEEARYHRLIDELRCLVCQNQNLADSNAGLARDLRGRTYDMISSGKSDDEILDYMVERYGDFVLYRPPFKPLTLVLWLCPTLFLLIAIGSFWMYSRRSGKKPVIQLSSSEREQAQRMLDE